jgi:hypothetical protein
MHTWPKQTAGVRSGPARSTWVRRTAVVAMLTLIGSFLTPVAPVSAAAADEALDREAAVYALGSGGPSVQRAAETALLGSADTVKAFIDKGWADAREADERAAAQVLAGMDGPAMRTAALQALDTSPAGVRTFISGGYKTAWDADERVRAYRLLEAGGPTMQAAGTKALAGTAEDLRQFLTTGQHAAAYADDRLAATRMLTGGPDNSGPMLHTAAQKALAGTREELRDFLDSGQFVARARDKELASIQSLTEQAKQAGLTTARESLAASQASTRAANAADEAKKYAQKAASEAKAAGGSAAKADAAAGRAADAARGAADAARDAIGASNAAMRAARIASDAASKATTAASLTARAATRAQQAAAGARRDKNQAAAARQAAEAARDAARKARELEQVRAQYNRALAEADAAGAAAKRASGNADEAADAADQAAAQAGVSDRQAQRARDAAAQARAAAAAASRAADRALRLAKAAAKAADQALTFAMQAAEHAERAAAAANAAADAAGDAAKAAEEAKKHADAAVQAANTAVAAANLAVEIEQLARQDDAARLAEDTAQGVLESQDARAEEAATNAVGGERAAWNRKLAWDTAEEDRVDAATRRLLDEASAAGASTAVVLDRARRAALALRVSGGQWTKEAAEEALGGGEVELRSWLTEGRKMAVGQDDRARVWHLIDTLPDGAEKTAAQTALAGDDAVVQQFLRTRSYSGKTALDRRTVYTLMEGAGPNLTSAANKALAGTAADVHQFLRAGQYPARAADERLEVYRTMEAGGPEVKAAGEVALAGPASYISYYLAVSRYQAQQRDIEQAAHVATVRALITQAQQYAHTALADAAKAGESAMLAAGKAAEAATYANQARKSAEDAGKSAAEAMTSAENARKSADEAAQSAATAREAANSAQNSAASAAKSAATATAAARRAQLDAEVAYQAKLQARADANTAGKDAVAADAAAKEAGQIYITRLKEFEAAQRSTAPGSGTGGTGTAADEHKTWGCLTELSISQQCLTVYKEFGLALINPAKCGSPATKNTSGCTMLQDLKNFVDQNPELLMDMLQFVLGGCGLIPGAGEVCDGLDAAISFKRGDWAGGFLSLGSMIPGLGTLTRGAKTAKDADKLRNIMNIVQDLAKGCKRTSSFVPGTKVLMGNGRYRDIEDVRVGDTVIATDPATNRTIRKAVTATVTSTGAKVLVDVTVDVDGDEGTRTATLTATHNHPFWVPDTSSWVQAEGLKAGQSLRTPSGNPVDIEKIWTRPAQSRVHNLTVEGIPTYYVVAGRTPVLVHNCGPGRELIDGDAQYHIIAGNKSGGGHKWPGQPGKSTFPKDWDTDRILDSVAEVATSPSSTWKWPDGVSPGTTLSRRGNPHRVQITGEVDGVKIMVIFEPHTDRIISGYPPDLK